MPLKSQLHVNQLLSNVSVQYKNQSYIWDKIFPMVPVMKDTDLYRVYEQNFRVPETRRAPKAVAREMEFYVSTSSYALEQHALKEYIGVDEAENYDLGGLQVDATEYLTDAIYRRIELTVAGLFTKTSWSLNVSLSSTLTFSQNTTISDPVAVFDTAASTILANSGYTPNFAFITNDTRIAIKNHVSVLDRVKYTSSEIDVGMIGSLLGVPELLIATAIYNSGNEGDVSATSLGNFYGDGAFVGWKPSAPGLKTPSCGYTFMRSAPRVRSWFDEERNANAVEVEIKFQPKIVASLTGYFIGNAV